MSRKTFERGYAGERRVAAELARLAPTFGLQVFHDVLVTSTYGRGGRLTAQLDHVVVDSQGVLIVESKTYDALIKGRDVDDRWTACYKGGRHHTFQNPLRQNEKHEGAVRQALEQARWRLPPDYVQSCVVFADANISNLELGSLARTKVTRLQDLERYLTERRDFAINKGLSEEQRVHLTQLVSQLDKSRDAEATARHAAYQQGRRSPKRSLAAGEHEPRPQAQAALPIVARLPRDGERPMQPPARAAVPVDVARPEVQVRRAYRRWTQQPQKRREPSPVLALVAAVPLLFLLTCTAVSLVGPLATMALNSALRAQRKPVSPLSMSPPGPPAPAGAPSALPRAPPWALPFSACRRPTRTSTAGWPTRTPPGSRSRGPAPRSHGSTSSPRGARRR